MLRSAVVIDRESKCHAAGSMAGGHGRGFSVQCANIVSDGYVTWNIVCKHFIVILYRVFSFVPGRDSWLILDIYSFEILFCFLSVACCGYDMYPLWESLMKQIIVISFRVFIIIKSVVL